LDSYRRAHDAHRNAHLESSCAEFSLELILLAFVTSLASFLKVMLSCLKFFFLISQLQF